MRVIVLAGGSGTRLYRITMAVSKHLLPAYDKHMFYYPISTLMLAGFQEIVVITTPHDQSSFTRLLGCCDQFRVNSKYLVQEMPKELAEIFAISKKVFSSEKTAHPFEDNIFRGTSFGTELGKFQNMQGAQIFEYHASNPQHYGVVKLNTDESAAEIFEKAIEPKNNLAILGLDFYEETVQEKVKKVELCMRGELEISLINLIYLVENQLAANIFKRGTIWLDIGTFETLYEASNYERVLQERQGDKISCLEEIGIRNHWISIDSVQKNLQNVTSKENANYLEDIACNG